MRVFLLLLVVLCGTSCVKHKSEEIVDQKSELSDEFYNPAIPCDSSVWIMDSIQMDTNWEAFIMQFDEREYMPEISQLHSSPNSYWEDISDYTIFPSEDYGKNNTYHDTTLRDFEKCWYDEDGRLRKYALFNWSDITFADSYFYYDGKGDILKIEINSSRAYPVPCMTRTVHFRKDNWVFMKSYGATRNLNQ